MNFQQRLADSWIGGDVPLNMSDTDLELLASYTREKGDDAFAEIVRRHLNLVYGAALRQVRSPQLAEEVAQCVFLELARQASRLSPDTILAAWLYKVTHRTSLNVVRGEIRRQVREQTVLQINAMEANNTTDWNEIEPLLDEGMHSLEESDRAAVLLRYFENKSLREVGQFFRASEDAAQKRVSRAVDRLREFFVKRGITIGASSLAAMLSTNAAQAAPVGLSAAITTSALGNTILTTATTTTTKAIAMTTLQKTVAAAVVLFLCGTGAVLVSSKVAKTSKSSEAIAVNLDNYVGKFEMTDHKIEIKKQANGLAVYIDDGATPLMAYAKAANRFASHDHNSLTELVFVDDGSGRATEFALVRDGRKLGDLKRAKQ